MTSTHPLNPLIWIDSLLSHVINKYLSPEDLLRLADQKKSCSYRFLQYRKDALLRILDMATSLSVTGPHYFMAFYDIAQESGFFDMCVRKHANVFRHYLREQSRRPKKAGDLTLSAAIVNQLPMNQKLYDVLTKHYINAIPLLKETTIIESLPYGLGVFNVYVNGDKEPSDALLEVYHEHLKKTEQFIEMPPKAIHEISCYRGMHHPYSNRKAFRAWSEDEKREALALYGTIVRRKDNAEIVQYLEAFLPWLEYQSYDERFVPFYEDLCSGFYERTNDKSRWGFNERVVHIPWLLFNNPDFRTILQGHCRWKDYAKLPLEARQFIAGDRFTEMEVIASIHPDHNESILATPEPIPEIELFCS